MIYIIFTILCIGSLIYLTLPFIQGANVALEANYLENRSSKDSKIEQLSDHIQSLKLALRDLDQENKIGKIDPGDFESIKDEMLIDWKYSEEQLNRLKSKTL
ncbi:MAG: hypothetical protein ABUK01_08890 [Leptospirales bacterium]